VRVNPMKRQNRSGCHILKLVLESTSALPAQKLTAGHVARRKITSNTPTDKKPRGGSVKTTKLKDQKPKEYFRPVLKRDRRRP